MSIAKFARNLKLNEQQIWVSTKINTVSYPVDGHSRCFQLEANSFWFQHRNDCIITAIKQFPPSGDILDIGGGNGYVTQRILNEGFDCTLLEPGFTGALNAKRQRKIPEVICSTLEAAQFEHGKLAAVGMFDVIEHIKDDRAIINEIYNLLQPKGLFYCTVPAYQWLWSRHDVTAGHFCRYSRSGIESLFSGRFELLSFSYFFFILVIPMFLLKALPFRVFGGRSILSPKIEHATEGGVSVNILKSLLNKEVEKIRNGRKILTGSSILVVARKK